VKLSAARAIASRKANVVELPADHPFALSTYASAASGKGGKNDKRRNRAKALRILEGRNV
jgi:hypothetical protein